MISIRQAISSYIALLLAASLLAGCGGGGGGGDDRVFSDPIASTPTVNEETSLQTVGGTLFMAVENGGRMTAREADRFLMRIPINQPQKLDLPEQGYAPMAGAEVSATLNGQSRKATANENGAWQIKNVPAGAQTFNVTDANGKKASLPIAVAKGKDHSHLGLITKDVDDSLKAEGQIIHGDGTDGYKKETHSDGTSDTVFEDGKRDHHKATGYTDRDLTDDGIVDQRFYDPDDDGVPNGPIMAVGGEEGEAAPSSAVVNNSAPEVKSVGSKNADGKKTTTVVSGETLTLEADAIDPDGDPVAVHWTVEDAYGNDVTDLFLDNPDIVAPTFSPPQGEFEKPGAYIVTVNASDPDALASGKDIILTVDSPGNKSPHASIKANHTAGEAPLTVDFECRAFDQDGAIVSYCWDFDKSNGIDAGDCDDNRPEVTKTFISEGKYRVTCVVTDDKGATAFDKRVIVVRKKASPPAIEKAEPSKAEASPGEAISIKTLVSDPDGGKTTVTIVSDDGTVSDSDSSDGSGTWVAPAEPGEYIIEVRAEDEEGEKSVEYIKVVVSEPGGNKPPSANAVPVSNGGAPSLTVALSANPTDVDGSIASTTWDFDDSDGIGIDATGANPTVTYGKPGDYVVTVITCDDDGACSTEKIPVTVEAPNSPPFVSDASPSSTSAGPGESVALVAQAEDADGDKLTYQWEVSGGTLSDPTDPMPVWTPPTEPGEYIAVVTVSDGVNPPQKKETKLTVTPEAPEGRPLPPEDCSVTGAAGGALVTWDASLSPDVESYQILRAESDGNFDIIQGDIPKSSRSFEDASLVDGRVYLYAVKAANGDGGESDVCDEEMEAVPQNEVDAAVPVGDEPADAEYDPTCDCVYVCNEGEDTVTVVSSKTNTVITTIEVGDRPTSLTINHGRQTVYVTNKGDDTVSVIDMSANSVIGLVNVGDAPDGCVAHESLNQVFVSNTGESTISVIDGNTNRVIKTIPVGAGPSACGVDEDSDTIYVTNRIDNTISFIDGVGLSILQTVAVGSGPAGCAVNETTNEVYIPLRDEGAIKAVDGDTGEEIARIPVGGAPVCTCGVNEISNQIYIANQTTNEIHLINGASKQEESTVTVGRNPSGVCADPGRNKICTANSGSDSLTILNNPLPAVQVDPIAPDAPAECSATGANASALVQWKSSASLDVNNYEVYRSANYGSFALVNGSISAGAVSFEDQGLTNGKIYQYQIVAVDGSGNRSAACQENAEAAPQGSIARAAAAGDGPADAVYDPICDCIYTPNKLDNTVSVIDPETGEIAATIPVGDQPIAVAIDISARNLFVVNLGDGSVDVVDQETRQVVKTIPVGASPNGCEVNQENHEIFVSLESSNEIVVISGDSLEITDRIPARAASKICGVDEEANLLYATSGPDGVLSAIDRNTKSEVCAASLGGEPAACAANDRPERISCHPGSASDACIEAEVCGSNGTLYGSACAACNAGADWYFYSAGLPCSGEGPATDVYAPLPDRGAIAVVDPETCQVEKTLDVGGGPECGCEVNRVSNQIYIANKLSNEVHLINGASQSVEKTVPVGRRPSGVCADPGRNQVCAANEGGDSVVIIDNPLPAVSFDPIAPQAPAECTAAGGNTSIEISWDAVDEEDVYGYNISRALSAGGPYETLADTQQVLSFGDQTVSNNIRYYYKVTAQDYYGNESQACMDDAIPQAEIANTAPTGGKGACCMDSIENIIYVANEVSNTVQVINRDTYEVIQTIHVNDCCGDIVTNKVTNKVFVTNKVNNTLTIIDGTNYVIEEVVEVGGGGRCVVNETTNEVYIVNDQTNEIVVYNPDTYETHTIYLESKPHDVEVDKIHNIIYVTNKESNSLTIINGTTYVVEEVIDLGSPPGDCIANEQTNMLYITSETENEVIVFNMATKQIVKRISVGAGPSCNTCGVNETSNQIYVTNSLSNTISLIDGATNEQVDTISVGENPGAILFDPDANKLYVLNLDDDNIFEIDNPLPAGSADETAPQTPAGFVASSANGVIILTWTANGEEDLAQYNIYRKASEGAAFGDPLATTINNTYSDEDVADGTTYYYAVTAKDTSGNESEVSSVKIGRSDVPTEVAVGSNPLNIAIDENGNRVFVSNKGGNTVNILDANSHAILGTVSSSLAQPWGLDVNPTTGKVYVANFSGATVTVFNGATGGNIASVPTGNIFLTGVAVDDQNGFYYVTHGGSNAVAKIQLSNDSVVNSMNTGFGSYGVDINRSTQMLYVANGGDDTVSIINAQSGATVATLNVGSEPTDVIVNETLNKVYVSCNAAATVYVISGTTNQVIGQIAVGIEPFGMGYDASRGYVYVANSGPGTVSVIDTATDKSIGEISVGGDPADVAVHSGLNKIFVPLLSFGKVIVRDGL